jgi:hypothetical protein
MYKLSSAPKYTYNATFILDFERRECTQYGRTGHDIIKTWWGNPTKFKSDAHGIYSTTSLDAHILYIAMMLCRLFGRKNPAHFTVEWVSIINEVVEGYTFNWAKMLSDNLAKEVVEYKSLKSRGKHAPFYMSTYIMDAICFMTPFPLMNWSWTPASSEPIHFYHSKLWEENAKDLFYEICHNVVVPIHVAIYGHPPPRISEHIMGNLGTIADWYIEQNFSYIRVFDCFISPHALPKFLPDRLVCREVAYQTVAGGIAKDLKVAQKKVWPTFPIQVGMFTLLDFGHSKVEAAALEDVKLVDIEFKRHDPHRMVENHLAQFNMKIYIHEDSPYDNVFRGARSYEEVENRFQTLPPDQQAGFLSFQKHRRNNLPKILQGESKPIPSSHETRSTEPQPSSSTEDKTEEVLNNTDALFKHIKASMPGLNDQQLLASLEAFMKHGHAFPPSSPVTTTVTPSVTSPEKSTALISPIPSVTPLSTSFEVPSSEVIHLDELTPILPEEMPPSSFFFNKKRKAIIRKESHQKEGVTTKRHK